jgi:serine/threonine-protein kinase
MEYIEGMTFEQAKPNRLDWFLQIMRKVAEGLDALHEIGYVHADIKPNNIILGKNGVVKIIDFGQSCRIGQRKERIQGTPEYIAPEQVKRWPLQRSTDVFNLGATMYWLLTEKPFPTGVRQSPAGLGVDLAGPQQALTPKQINAKIPPALSQLVMDCCREIPSERPADMKQVLARLDVVQRMWRRQQIALKNQRTTSREAKGIALQNRRSATEQQHE